LFLMDNTVERAPGQSVDFGSAITGEPIDKRFRIRNIGQATATLSSLTVTGAGFTLVNEPTVPFTLVGGAGVDFRVRFLVFTVSPPYSSTLRVNGTPTTLTATVNPVPRLRLEDEGVLRPWDTSLTVNFWQVERGLTATRRFVLDNPHATPLTINAMSVEGAGYRLAAAPALPKRLNSGESLAFEVVFAPASAGLFAGGLVIDQRRFPLTGAGIEPPPPRPTVILSAASYESAKQGRVSIKLAAASRANVNGRLRIDFTPTSPGPDDTSVQFLATSNRAVPLEIRQGDTEARFGSLREAGFQTGTTAGTLRVIVEVGGFIEEARAAIAPAAVVLDTLKVTRMDNRQFEVQLSGFDNARTASAVAFTFFNRNGVVIQPGAIRTDVTGAFREFFGSSPLGGMFSLRALFPVNGDFSSIGGLEVELTNSMGTTRPPRATF
jgi:hypothetical protein